MKGVFSLVFALPLVSSLALNASTTAVIDLALVEGGNFGAVTKFLGIPYAKAARFALPVPIPVYLKALHATAYGPSCPAQLISSAALTRRSSDLQDSPALKHLTARDNTAPSEDCLSVNVIRPAGSRLSDKLPVVVWIYGGGFETGNTLSYDEVGTTVVTRSIQLGKPIIFVSMNYRISAFGFLASAEVQKEKIGNFGLYDQRLALQWTKKYIRNFGGDPSKITIWGQSAGAISASLHMLAFGGKIDNLFRGAFMQSGAPISVGPLSKGQKYYDFLVTETNCTKASSTLKCLRTAPLDILTAAINKTPNYMSYQGLSLAWSPRVDGTFLQQSPFAQIRVGKVANIPIVSGNVDDEGTLFSFAQSNVTTDADFVDFVKNVYAPSATGAELATVAVNYPSDPAAGSPFDTGSNDVAYPQYKRIAAFQGDIAFQAPKRYFLQNLSGKQKIWSYLSKVYKSASVLGSYHHSDIDSGILVDNLINFVVSLDPNSPSTPSAWPQYTKATPNLYTFTDAAPPSITNDTYRAVPMSDLITLSTAYPV